MNQLDKSLRSYQRNFYPFWMTIFPISYIGLIAFFLQKFYQINSHLTKMSNSRMYSYMYHLEGAAWNGLGMLFFLGLCPLFLYWLAPHLMQFYLRCIGVVVHELIFPTIANLMVEIQSNLSIFKLPMCYIIEVDYKLLHDLFSRFTDFITLSARMAVLSKGGEREKSALRFFLAEKILKAKDRCFFHFLLLYIFFNPIVWIMIAGIIIYFSFLSFYTGEVLEFIDVEEMEPALSNLQDLNISKYPKEIWLLLLVLMIHIVLWIRYHRQRVYLRDKAIVENVDGSNYKNAIAILLVGEKQFSSFNFDTYVKQIENWPLYFLLFECMSITPSLPRRVKKLLAKER